MVESYLLKIKEIEVYGKDRGYKSFHSNGIHNFVNADIREGFTVKSKSLDWYWVDQDDEKQYNHGSLSEHTRDTIKYINEKIMLMSPESNPEPIPEPTPEITKILESETPPAGAVANVNDRGIIPTNLSSELLEKHPGSLGILMMCQHTLDKDIKTKPGRGGKEVPYVEGALMVNQANYAFLFRWDSEVLEFFEDEFEISALVKCTFHFTEGYSVVHTQMGTSEKKFSKTLKDGEGNPRAIMLGDTRKAAITDGEKKNMSKLGMNKDVYGVS